MEPNIILELDGDEDNKKVFEGMIDKGGPTEGEDTGHGEYLAEYVHQLQRGHMESFLKSVNVNRPRARTPDTPSALPSTSTYFKEAIRKFS